MNRLDLIIRKLSNRDKKELKESLGANYTCYPKFGKNGRILPTQWRTWQNLQRWGCAYIIGSDDNGKLELSEFGKEITKIIK